MFNDRCWIWKILITLFLLAGLFHYGLREGRRAYPEIWEYMIDPEGFEGRQIWIPLGEVQAVGNEGYSLYDPGNDKVFRVNSPLPPGIAGGDRLEAIGVFHADRSVTIGPGGVRLLPGHRLSRRFMMAVSIAALVWLAWRTSRNYRWAGTAPSPFIRR